MVIFILSFFLKYKKKLIFDYKEKSSMISSYIHFSKKFIKKQGCKNKNNLFFGWPISKTIEFDFAAATMLSCEFLFVSFVSVSFPFCFLCLKSFFSSVEKKVCYKSDKKRFLQISKELQHPLRGERHFNFVKRKLFHPKCFIIWYESLNCVWLTWETKHLNVF